MTVLSLTKGDEMTTSRLLLTTAGAIALATLVALLIWWGMDLFTAEEFAPRWRARLAEFG